MTSRVLEEDRLTSTPAQRLRVTTAAVRVSLKWLGVRRALSPEQRSRAAEPFHAEGDFISAGKKLLDTSHPAYRAVTGVRGNITRYWKSVTLPYPEPGVRLIKQASIEGFDHQMNEFREQLDEAVVRLDEHYAELKIAAQQRLGQLYNADDYPPILRGLFEVSWDFPSVEPPPYLLELSPALYEQEKARVAARFQEAVTLAEQAFIDEFSRLVAHLSERLAGGADGETKVFRDSAITNLVEFFDRFRDLNVRSNAQLDELVERVQQMVHGVEPQDLRDNVGLRQQIATQLGQVQNVIDDLMIDMPRRRIVRTAPPPTESAMILRIDPTGTIRTIYGEEIDLTLLGRPLIRRASSVEPDREGKWWTDLLPAGGPRQGPFRHRSQALEAERRWLIEHWLLH